MGFPEGNKFWEARSSHGRKAKWEDPDELKAACIEYFEWVTQNPIHEDKVISSKDGPEHASLIKMRAMTIEGLCVFLGICRNTWKNLSKKSENDPKRDDFLRVVSFVESVMHEQKFTGAAAGVLNSNIIARDLGLKDQTQSEVSGPNGTPIPVIKADMTQEDAANAYQDLLKHGLEES